MREAKLSQLVQASLTKQFKDCCYINKNHGNQFQSSGRPDIEGNIFGRHFGFELKTKSRFTPTQVSHINRIHKSGGIGAGIVYNDGKVYYLNCNQVTNFSLKHKQQWTEIPMNRYLDFTFLYKYLNVFYLYFHGEEHVLS